MEGCLRRGRGQAWPWPNVEQGSAQNGAGLGAGHLCAGGGSCWTRLASSVPAGEGRRRNILLHPLLPLALLHSPDCTRSFHTRIVLRPLRSPVALALLHSLLALHSRFLHSPVALAPCTGPWLPLASPWALATAGLHSPMAAFGFYLGLGYRWPPLAIGCLRPPLALHWSLAAFTLHLGSCDRTMVCGLFFALSPHDGLRPFPPFDWCPGLVCCPGQCGGLRQCVSLDSVEPWTVCCPGTAFQNRLPQS